MDSERSRRELRGNKEARRFKAARLANGPDEPDRQAASPRQLDHVAIAIGDVFRRQIRFPPLRYASQNGIRQTDGTARARTDELHALADRHLGGSLKIEQLKSRDTQAPANTRSHLLGLRDESIERLIEAAERCRHAERQAKGKSAVARIECLHAGIGIERIARKGARPFRIHEHAQSGFPSRRELRHESFSQTPFFACRPTAHALASMARLPSGFTCTSCRPPSEHPSTTCLPDLANAPAAGTSHPS